jgi:hypothetical protein
MAELGITLLVLGGLAVKGAAILVLVYLGARLAIRHERLASQ